MTENERKRLSEFYHGLTDGELENIAEDPTSLTPVAREELTWELKNREFGTFQDNTIKAVTKPEFRNLVTIRRYRDLTDASLAKGCLESAGIECFLADDNLVSVDWFVSQAIGGVKLQVKIDDAEESLVILNQPIPEGFEDEEQ